MTRKISVVKLLVVRKHTGEQTEENYVASTAKKN